MSIRGIGAPGRGIHGPTGPDLYAGACRGWPALRYAPPVAATLAPTYVALIRDRVRTPSWIVAFLPPESPEPTVTSLLAALRASSLGLKRSAVLPEAEHEGAAFELELELELPGGAGRTARLWQQPKSEALDRLHLESAKHDGSGTPPVTASRFVLGVGLKFGDDPLGDYHLQLRLLDAVAPTAVSMIDVDACVTRPGAWLRETAQRQTPPSPKSLYSIHQVFEEGRPGVWLHTHGLHRSGVIELEMLDVPEGQALAMAQLINVVAPLFIERGVPEVDEVFEAGRALPLFWRPWERCVARLRNKALGGSADRQGSVHELPSGVLYAPRRRFLGLFGSDAASPVVYSAMLGDNPLLYVPTMETRRLEMLSRERFEDFRALQAAHAGQEKWVFLMKLGYPVDGAEDDSREHLWFEVHAIAGDRVDATLINAPYAVAQLTEGTRGIHDLSLMSDWTILCERGRFDPETVKGLLSS